MKRILSIIVPALACGMTLPALAAQTLPSLDDQDPKHKVFMNSKNQANEGFDVWQIDSGYAYNLFDSFDLYVGTRIKNKSDDADRGFLSGVSYQFNDKITVNSTLYKGEGNAIENDPSFNAEVSGSYEVTNGLNLHATLDYDEWQQGITVGLGYNF
jgi:hypothetical protein